MSKRSFIAFLALIAVIVTMRPAAADVGVGLTNKTVVFQNAMNKRYLLSDGAAPTAAEGGWTSAPKIVGADANYYDRAQWKIIPSGDGYLIQNNVTKRYLLSEGAPVAGASEGGWTASPKVVGADKDYYGRAIWKLTPSGDGYLVQNAMTKRYLLSDGAAPTNGEGGWTKSPAVVGADANYYSRAIWRISAP